MLVVLVCGGLSRASQLKARALGICGFGDSLRSLPLLIRTLLILTSGTAPVMAQSRSTQCSPRPPRAATAFSPDQVLQLTGSFSLVFVATSQGTSPAPWGGILTLQAHDSLRRYRFVERRIGHAPGQRPLWGWIDSSTANGSWVTRMASRDPDYPGVEWIGGGLVFGWFDSMDGVTTHLTVTHVARTGFWGRWRSGGGIELLTDSAGHPIPDPAGYFCALRQ
jgi:hypothetical protein